MMTPAYALDPLVPWLHRYARNDLIWEPFPGRRHLVRALEANGFDCIRADLWHPERLSWPLSTIRAIVTNPPYSNKDEIIERCYEIGLPFALLLPLEALGGVGRGLLYRKHGLQVIVPNRRVNFITPRRGRSSWFPTAWFTWKLRLPRDLIFEEMSR